MWSYEDFRSGYQTRMWKRAMQGPEAWEGRYEGIPRGISWRTSIVPSMSLRTPCWVGVSTRILIRTGVRRGNKIGMARIVLRELIREKRDNRASMARGACNPKEFPGALYQREQIRDERGIHAIITREMRLSDLTSLRLDDTG